MTVGMMWWSGSKEDLATKIREAMEYYHKKYGRRPDKAFVHPSEIEKVEVEGLTVSPDKYILPKQIWIGIEDKS